MSIRAKILSILLSALVMAFIVSALAYWHAGRLEDQLGIIIDKRLPASRAARGLREEMEHVAAAEDRMISVDDASWRAVIDEALNNARGHVSAGQQSAGSSQDEQEWSELSAQLRELRRSEVRLADLIATEIREVQGQQRRLQPRLARQRRALGSLAAELEQESLEMSAQGRQEGDQADRYRRAARAGREAADLLVELEELRYSASRYEAFAPDFQRQLIPRRVELARDRLREVEVSLAGSPWAERGQLASSSFGEQVGELEEVSRRILDVNGRLVAVREDTRLARERVLRRAGALERRHLDDIEARRLELAARKDRMGALIVGLLMFGVLGVGGLALLVLRSLSTKIAALLRVSRHLQRGELDARVEISGRDELAEVGASFNAMAHYLQVRRKRQNDYNEIVSLLNSSIGVQETISECLGEIVERTGSTLGAVYLYEEGTGSLTLADHFGLDGKAQARREVRVGEGLIGQVARARRRALVRPVPEGAFDLDLGVGEVAPQSALILPLVHLEVLLGVVVLGSASGYEEEDVRFIEEVIFQMAVAVSNAVFYQTIERTAEALRAQHDRLMAQQRDLERANLRLEEANRLKTEFLANVTHELRTPLNSIIGFTELVLESERFEDRQRRNLRTVLRNAENLLRLINDLLDISRMEAGNITLSLERFDARELIEESVEMVRPLVEAKQLQIQSRLPASLPMMRSDRTKSKQIIVNLLSNAIKFTETGGIVVEAEVEDAGRWVAIHVRDSGIGMRPEDLGVIFEKFRQLDGSSSRKYGGAGLGLAITRQLCTLLGGEVSAASVLGEGSTFTVRLPTLVTLEEGEVGEEEEAGRAEEGGRRFVLVLDDDPMTVVALREGLMEAGLEVKSAFTASDAKDILSAFEPVCVVIGAALPDEDGGSQMKDVWQIIKSRALPVLLIWNGEGEIPRFGYPAHEDRLEAGWTSDLSDRTIARVVGRIGRPVGAPQLMACLREAHLVPKEGA